MPPYDLVQKLKLDQAAGLNAIGSRYLDALVLRGGCLTKNLSKDTEDFTTANWTAVALAAAPTKNVRTSPRGDKTMLKIVEDSSLGVHQVITAHPAASFAVTAFGQVALSVHAAAAERNWLVLGFQDAGGGGAFGQAFFDVLNGNVGGFVGSATTLVSKEIELSAPGIYRCKLVLQRQSGASGQMYFGLATGDGADSYTGNGVSGIYVWGSQAQDQAAAVLCYRPVPFGAAQAAAASYDFVTPEAYVAAALEIGRAFKAAVEAQGG